MPAALQLRKEIKHMGDAPARTTVSPLAQAGPYSEPFGLSWREPTQE